jgi:hypothetical protein
MRRRAHLDVVSVETEGFGRIRADYPAPDLGAAVLRAIRAVEAAGLRAVRVDSGDWMTLGDIGARLGRSREIVRLWSTGRQGPGGFPPPHNPGKDTSFFSWAEVAPWLRTRMRYDLPDEEPVLAAMNLALQLRDLMPRLANTAAVLSLLDPDAQSRSNSPS